MQRGEDPELLAVLAIIAHNAPDLLLLTDIDYDYDALALSALAEALDYPQHFALRPNTGLQTDFDLDGDGRFGDARDAQGYGRFSGDGGMAILSQFAIDATQVTDLSDVFWRDVPNAVLPTTMTSEIAAIQRLSTSGHWIVPIDTRIGPVTLLAFAATPPVFDGPEDRNGLRNRDELMIWQHVLDGKYGAAPSNFVLLGNANLDPLGGEGYSTAMAEVLRDPRLTDPHTGKPTANWPEDGPGNLRVSYVLPAANFTVRDAGVFWPAPDDPDATLLGDDGLAAGVHHLVWVDIDSTT
ncbi:endonuclease/exonuclease/phosphatase family protein [Yoonia ponticola]|uniref:endonuclease/exonuclease/phosphatase family protein n=1 Tax=Yoonia ponticola TaxID=1524255 RepID=UPI0031B61731